MSVMSVAFRPTHTRRLLVLGSLVAALAVSPVAVRAQTGLQVLHEFYKDVGRPDSLMLAGDGETFCGTSATGGRYDLGLAFALIRGTDGLLHEQILYEFSTPDGVSPVAALIQGPGGVLYGVTQSGGEFDRGVIFSLTTTGVYTILHSFTGADGSNPQGRLLLASDGRLYGTTTAGGAGGAGTFFRIQVDGNDFIVLHEFSSAVDGQAPVSGLIEASDGNFYGTTIRGRRRWRRYAVSVDTGRRHQRLAQLLRCLGRRICALQRRRPGR